MHSTQADTLKSFIEKIKTIGFFQRLFSWNSIRSQLIDAASSLATILTDKEHLETINGSLTTELNNSKKDAEIAIKAQIRHEESIRTKDSLISEKEKIILDLNKELTTQSTNYKNSEKKVQDLDKERISSIERINSLDKELREKSDECIRYRQKEEGRNREHNTSLSTLTTLTTQVREEREIEKKEKQTLEVERVRKLKETWINHETSVKNTLRSLCIKLVVEYVEEVPFDGKPDNTLKICGEFIIFDAKSPGGEEISNFQSYLKDQAEKAKKYARQENVKSDIFFVVPSNTLDVIRQTCFHLGDYCVYIISADSLEPIIHSLKKIENYEFAQQLTPEERENICRVIGKFAHLTKRRIQIDSYFARQFMEIVYKCESSLPDDILDRVAEFEKSEKLNPPLEKRARAINTRLLDSDLTKLETELDTKGIMIGDLSDGLNKIKLYKE